MFPERFEHLPPYAFPRLRALLDEHPAGGDVVNMTIGEPKHPFPEFVREVLMSSLDSLNSYPANNGTPALLEAIHGWILRRYGVFVDPQKQLMALNGTREGLYNAAMALCPDIKNGKRPVIMTPNPFYQVYMIAGLSVGAEIDFLPATAETGHLPDFSAIAPERLDQVAIVYLCSPANPQGAVADRAYWANLIGLAEKHDFKIFADECYSEIYRDTPPVGALEVVKEIGADPERVVVFHSLSKRSNLPGLRSGFVCSGPENIKRVQQLRSYAGAPLAGPLQAVAAAAWSDEAHVVENRALYAEKFDLADQIFDGVEGYHSPPAGFFLWLPVQDGEAAALKLWRETGVRVLPGAYLSKEIAGTSPGHSYIRVALVAPKEQTNTGLRRLRACLYR